MITCRFNGRLGNNLFQIATVLSLSKKINTEAIFDFTTWAGHRGEIPVDLSIFTYDFKRGNPKFKYTYNEIDFTYNDIKIVDNTQLSGFYQSWKYFEDIRNDLLNTYYTPSLIIQNKLAKYNISENALGISVRREDYIMLQQNHCVLSLEYYQNAINKYFQDNIDSIYIFSDDIEWCKTVFGTNVNYVTEDVGTQLFLMSKMKHLILSNSTFAWWGAYLNQNDGIIVAPSPWFGLAYADKDTSDLYYPTWKIETHNIKTV